MIVEYKPRFTRSFEKLFPNRQQKVRDTIRSILDFFNKKGSLLPGLGLKNFQGDFWEIRVDIHDRIIFELADNKIIFWLIGNHDEVRRFVRNK